MKLRYVGLALIIAFTTISMRSVNNMISTTIPLFSKYELNFSSSEIGLLTSLSFLSTFVATTFINPRLRKDARKLIFILSSFCIIIILVLFYYSNTFTIWIFSIFAGFSYGFITPNIITSSSLFEEKDIAERILAIYSVSLSLSLIIGPSFETYLLNYFDYRHIFLLFIPIAIPLFLLSFFIRFPEVKRESYNFKEINKRVLFASILNLLIYNIPFSILTVFAAIYSIEVYHVPGTIAYSIYIPFLVVSFLTRSYMAYKPFKNLKKPITISTIFTALGIIILALPLNFYAVIVAMILLGIPHGAIYPMSTIMISRGTDIKERNAVNSYFVAFGNIIAIVVPPLFGYLLSYFGFRILIASLSIPVVFFYILFRKRYFNEKFLYR